MAVIPLIKLNKNLITYIEGGVLFGLAAGLAIAFLTKGKYVTYVVAATVLGAGLGTAQYYLNQKIENDKQIQFNERT